MWQADRDAWAGWRGEIKKRKGKIQLKIGAGFQWIRGRGPYFFKSKCETYFRFGLEPLEIIFYFAKKCDNWFLNWSWMSWNLDEWEAVLFHLISTYVWICFLWFSTLYHGIHHRFTAIWGMCFYLFNHLKANLSVFLESSTSSSQVMTKRPRHWRRAGQLWPEEPYLCQCLPGSSWKIVFFQKETKNICSPLWLLNGVWHFGIK